MSTEDTRDENNESSVEEPKLEPAVDTHGHDDGHGHSRFIQHHYDDAQHQFETGKLGIWAFLAQEILFFSALFVAYVIWRYNHPETFAYAHKYLDVKWGAINTAVLIISSLTAAWAVRAAQLNQQRLLVACIAMTILCACGFLGIKYIEYSHKFHERIVFGCGFSPKVTPDGRELYWPKTTEEERAEGALSTPSNCRVLNRPEAKLKSEVEAAGEGAAAESATGAEGTAGADGAVAGVEGEAAAGAEAPSVGHDASAVPPPGTNMFFTIYFAMTGLHGLHVLVGIFVFVWLLIRAVKGHFTPEYFGPIDYAALYWHLVDLIWIYLFPLLYLIH